MARKRIPDYALYGESAAESRDRRVHVETIQVRSARHHWKIDAHLHRQLHQLVIVQRGRGIAVAEGNVSHFNPPAAMLVPAGTPHAFEFEPGTVGFVVSLSDELLREFAAREPQLSGLFAGPATLEMQAEGAGTAALLQAARQLAQEHSRAAAGRALALEGQVCLLLVNALRLAQSLAPSQGTPLTRQRQLVARFRALVESGFRENRRIPDYARQLRVTEAQLRNACLAATSQPPIQVVQARVLLEAKRQLFYTTKPIAEVAWSLGFDDAAYFTRFFTRRAGSSPRRYRRERPGTDARDT
jgi:AraC family transcriptional activator of pobA